MTPGGTEMRLAISNASRDWRGTETIALDLCIGLRDRGHEVVLICRADSPLHERMSAEVPCEPVLRSSDASPAALMGVLRALRRHRSDLVVLQKEKDVRITGPVAALNGTPVVVRHETDRPLKRSPHYRFYYGWVPSHHIVNSRATLDTLLASAPWLRQTAFTLIPNGIDATPFARGPALPLDPPADAMRVGFVGRMEERKGVLDLAAAWPGIAAAEPRAHLYLAGSGALEDRVRAALQSAPRVHWLGFQSDVPALLRAMDVVVVPSHFEGFGLSAIEAMAAGRAVVATRTSSLQEVVRDGVDGLLVPPREPALLARAVVDLLRDDARRMALGAAGRQHVEREYTIPRMLDAHEALFTRLLRRDGHSG